MVLTLLFVTAEYRLVIVRKINFYGIFDHTVTNYKKTWEKFLSLPSHDKIIDFIFVSFFNYEIINP